VHFDVSGEGELRKGAKNSKAELSAFASLREPPLNLNGTFLCLVVFQSRVFRQLLWFYGQPGRMKTITLQFLHTNEPGFEQSSSEEGRPVINKIRG